MLSPCEKIWIFPGSPEPRFLKIWPREVAAAGGAGAAARWEPRWLLPALPGVKPHCQVPNSRGSGCASWGRGGSAPKDPLLQRLISLFLQGLAFN